MLYRKHNENKLYQSIKKKRERERMAKFGYLYTYIKKQSKYAHFTEFE